MRKWIISLSLLLLAGTACTSRTDTPASLNPQGVKLAVYALVDDSKTAVVNPKESLLTTSEMLSLVHVDVQRSASQLQADYDANEIAADQQYKGKKILLSGIIDSINKDVTGDGYLTLQSSSPLGVQARLSNRGMQGASLLAKGTYIYLVCDPGMRVATIPIVEHCQRFSQYLEELRPRLETTVTEFLQGRTALPRKAAQAIAMMYVVGSELPPDSPCLAGDGKACDALVDSVGHDKARMKDVGSKAEKLLASLKIS